MSKGKRKRLVSYFREEGQGAALMWGHLSRGPKEMAGAETQSKDVFVMFKKLETVGW